MSRLRRLSGSRRLRIYSLHWVRCSERKQGVRRHHGATAQLDPSEDSPYNSASRRCVNLVSCPMRAQTAGSRIQRARTWQTARQVGRVVHSAPTTCAAKRRRRRLSLRRYGRGACAQRIVAGGLPPADGASRGKVINRTEQRPTSQVEWERVKECMTRRKHASGNIGRVSIQTSIVFRTTSFGTVILVDRCYIKSTRDWGMTAYSLPFLDLY